MSLLHTPQHRVGPHLYRIPKFVVGSFGLASVFPTEGSILNDFSEIWE
jgi:hypothetical protein